MKKKLIVLLINGYYIYFLRQNFEGAVLRSLQQNCSFAVSHYKNITLKTNKEKSLKSTCIIVWSSKTIYYIIPKETKSYRFFFFSFDYGTQGCIRASRNRLKHFRNLKSHFYYLRASLDIRQIKKQNLKKITKKYH